MARSRNMTSLSRAANSGLERCGEINAPCHGWTGEVPGDPDHVMTSPRVYAIYWDDYFVRNKKAVNRMNRFFLEILGSVYMRQLAQYGVGPAAFSGSAVVPADAAARAQVNPDHPEYIEAQLRAWIEQGIVRERPARAERNPLYVIFTPRGTSIGECLCGYHQSGYFGKTSGDKNLFWAAIQEWHHDFSPESEPRVRQLVDSCSWCVSHEMVEAFTNPDGQGYHTNDSDHPDGGCEIGDICECAKGSAGMKTPIITTQIGGWWVEPYWDNQNQSCYPLHVVPRKEAPQGGYESAGGTKGGT